MYYKKVEICGVNTAKLAVLTDEQKTALLLRTKAGDTEARQEPLGSPFCVAFLPARIIDKHGNVCYTTAK